MYEDEITQLSQSIYLARNNRYNDVEGQELTDFLNQSIDWINQFLQELEMEANWNYLRTNDYTLGTVPDTATSSFLLPTTVRTIAYSPYRDLTINQDGTPVSTFRMVDPTLILDPTDRDLIDRATIVGRNLILSRNPKEIEVGGEIKADVLTYMPKLSMDNIDVLNLVYPTSLIILGVAKNATLPDIVQGGISPSLAQKYNDLLQKAIAENGKSTDSPFAPREDFGFIRGIY